MGVSEISRPIPNPEEFHQSRFAGQLAMEYLNSSVPVLTRMVERGQGRNLHAGQMRDGKVEDDVFIDIDTVGEEIFRDILATYPDQKVSVFGEHSEEVHEGVDLIVCTDSFDNTTQYRRGLDTTPYTAMSVYGKDGSPLASGIANLHTGLSTIAVDGKVYEFDFSKKNGIAAPKRVEPSKRRALNNKMLTIASYMGSNKYLFPVMNQFDDVYKAMSKKGVIYASGGAFVYMPMVQGIIDAYIMPGEPNSETAAGIAMLQIAGGTAVIVENDMSVKHWRFDPNRFGENENMLVAAGNPYIADKIIGKVSPEARENFRNLLVAA